MAASPGSEQDQDYGRDQLFQDGGLDPEHGVATGDRSLQDRYNRGGVAPLGEGLGGPHLAVCHDLLEVCYESAFAGVVATDLIDLEDEDSVTERFVRNRNNPEKINIDIIRLPHISNFSDFDVFNMFEDVNLNYADSADDVQNPDIIIIPGSKSTIEDLKFIRRTGIEKKIIKHYKTGGIIIGICAGFQMLGKKLNDPYLVEGGTKKIKGIGIFKTKTVMSKEKVTVQTSGEIASGRGILKNLKGMKIKGYEIHMGATKGLKPGTELAITETGSNDGIVAKNAIGTYIHGIFDNAEITRGLLNNIRNHKGLKTVQSKGSFENKKEAEFNRLADIVRSSIDIKKIYGIMKSKK